MTEYSPEARKLAAKIGEAKKYRDVHPDVIARVCAETQGRFKKPKDWEKAARAALHGITGAFTDADARTRDGDDPLTALLRSHASTAERLPLARMDALYERIFSVTGTPGELLDLACGLNPVYLRARYPDMRIVGVDASHRCAQLCTDPDQPRCVGVWADLLSPDVVPRAPFDLALLFKLVPLLERQRAGSAAEMMRGIDAKWLAVSFPTRTLGGRNVGMAAHYAEWMDAHMPREFAVAERFEDGGELYYILSRARDASPAAPDPCSTTAEA